MTSYVEELVASELPRAMEAIGIRIRDITGEAAARKALGNSRIFIEYQTAIVEGLGAYGRTLREQLGQFDANHSPVSIGDFDKAIGSIDELSRRAMELYEKKRENQKPFGGNCLPFEEARMAAAVTGAKNELRGLQREHASRRSIRKRWIEPGLDAFGQNLVFMLLLMAFVFLLGMIFHQPLDMVLDALVKLGIGR
jgi:hypothetical protein